MRRFARPSCFALLAAIATAGCGSKSPLIIPDIGPDIVDATDVQDVQDVFDVFEACVPGRFTLQRRNADVMLVIDRSGSMNWNLAGQPMMPPSRWTVLQGALQSVLPPLENDVSFGAIFYPMVISDPGDISMVCGTNLTADVLPARGNANRILSFFTSTMPNGGTPTARAVGLAQQVLSVQAGRGDGQYIVLATDGAPNCNSDVPFSSCVCTSPPDPMTGQSPCDDSTEGRSNCLNDVQTVNVIRSVAMSGVPVYVIGIADMGDPTFENVLNQMAVAGGRPNMAGPQQFYSVRQPADLANAFRTISQSIAQCAFVTPSRPDNPDAITIFLNGMPVSRDTSHMSGWDWTDRTFGEITFFGAACGTIVGNPGSTVTAQVGCNDQ